MANSNNYGSKSLIINRKLHIYLGLFLLLFIWLFFVSGLIMNHSKWKITRFYEKRIESKTDISIPSNIINGNNEPVKRIKDHLQLTGEVSNIRLKPDNIGFRVSSPGLMKEVTIDPLTGKGSMKVMKYNFWGKLHTLHLFNGMNKRDPAQRPNWTVTKLWRIMMDVTAIILIVLSMGSWIMWYKVRKDYKWGYIFLVSGIILSGYYMFLTDFF